MKIGNFYEKKITELQYKLILRERKITQEEEDYLKEVVRGYIDAVLWTKEERLKDEIGYDVVL
jgi:hypothetical protein